MKGGFLYVDDLLRHQDFRDTTIEQIQQIVDTNDKQRFTLETDNDTGRLKIRANQGHTMQIDELELKPIVNAEEFPVVVHGTYEKNVDKILTEGLKPMGRNHVHFAAGEPGQDGVISGMRTSCTVAIYLNLQRAVDGGLKFYQSANNVILCPGDQNGVISPVYFDKIKNRRSGKTHCVHTPGQGDPDETSAAGVECAAPHSPETSVVASATVTADDLAEEMDRQKKAKKKNKRK
ncbi:tRNA 2'-phosphotransferase 1 [Aplysia californica]|uniref:2'-phosphotransferase n=1 Tax=Aplysia californica TaxID=6500 RepID=A0ABM1W475_APLCA|nr:tRNA 2'-phosphotransferase 1 [Aplysia californica]